MDLVILHQFRQQPRRSRKRRSTRCSSRSPPAWRCRRPTRTRPPMRPRRSATTRSRADQRQHHPGQHPEPARQREQRLQSINTLLEQRAVDHGTGAERHHQFAEHATRWPPRSPARRSSCSASPTPRRPTAPICSAARAAPWPPFQTDASGNIVYMGDGGQSQAAIAPGTNGQRHRQWRRVHDRPRRATASASVTAAAGNTRHRQLISQGVVKRRAAAAFQAGQRRSR